jgi:2,3-bisphosphoglycerate-independent phosphoglycerate mutase
MIEFPCLADIVHKNDSKVVMLVLGGTGGTPEPILGRTALEAARVPNLDAEVQVAAGYLANPADSNGRSWHAVPFVIRSARTLGDSGVESLNERDLRSGSLGQFEAKHAVTLVLAHAGRLNQFGD